MFFSEIIGEGLLLPHRDHNVSCCVNLYFEPNGSTTFFHKEKENIDAFVYPGKSTANIYDLRQVNTVGKFIAKKNDSLETCMNKKMFKDIRHLLVVDDKNEEFVGMISIKDLIKEIMKKNDDIVTRLSDFKMGKGAYFVSE